MKKHIFCFIIVIFFSGKLFASVDDCSAFFIKKGVAAGFPLMKKRNVWEWYKKIRPEYVWMAETGFYVDKKFVGNGFGFALNIGAADVSNKSIQKGNVDDLIRFTAKNAFLTKESKYYKNEEKKEKIQFKTLVAAKVLDDESIVVAVVDPEAVKMAKMENPTHMKLTAILPEKDESYTCYPAIEIIK
jgi:hypothetical protein